MIVSQSANPYLNVRLKPNGNKIGRVYPGTKVEVESNTNGWSQLRVKVGTNVVPSNLYVSSEYLESETSPTPAPVAIKPKIGLHVMSNGHIAGAEAAKGCKFFMIMDNFLSAHQIKTAYPDAVVMVRKYIRNRVPITDMVRALEVYPESRLVYTGHNESDVIGTSPDAIVERAKFDVEMAKAIKAIAPNARYAAGTYSRGEPDLWSPAVIDAVKTWYAPHFNSGLIDFDMHSYSISSDLNEADRFWIVCRWQRLFEVCGFNPERAQSIYSSETGVDDGKLHGFAGTNSTNQQVEIWCQKYISANGTLVLNGKTYNNIFVGGAIFQFGGNGDAQWNGFEASKYIENIRRYY